MKTKNANKGNGPSGGQPPVTGQASKPSSPTPPPALKPPVPAPTGAKKQPKAKAAGKKIIQNIPPESGDTAKPEVEPIQYGWLPQPDEHPLLAELRVSRFSRSYVTPPTDESVAEMAKSITEYGLINGLILAANPDEPGKLDVVAGEHRRQALLHLRPGGRLLPHEYRILDIPATDRRLAAVSMAENSGREEPSPYELALLAGHLIEDEKFTQEEVAKLMGKFQPTINGLQGLAKSVKVLPKKWQEDLRKPPTAKAVIRLAHWLAVKPHLKADGTMPASVAKICEQAASKEWSVADLKKALGPSKKRAKSPITDTTNLHELPTPAIEAPAVSDKTRKAVVAELRSCAEKLARIAEDLHMRHPEIEKLVRDVVQAVEAKLAVQTPGGS